MRCARLFVLIASLMVASLMTAAKPTVILPGRWEVTIRTELPVSAPAMTTVVCIIQEDAEDPKPPKSKATDDCKVTGGGRAGSVLTYTVKCDARKSHSSARFTFQSDSFEGVVEGKADDRDLRQVYSGRRIGDCDETPQPELP